MMLYLGGSCARNSYPNDLMVEKLTKQKRITSRPVINLMKNVNRQFFCPGVPRHFAFGDNSVSIGYSARMSSPSHHGCALELLQYALPEGGSALDVGCGSGYMTACLAILAGSCGMVIGLDHVEPLIKQATANVCKLHYPRYLYENGNVQFITTDGRLGWIPGAPYHAIYVENIAGKFHRMFQIFIFWTSFTMGVKAWPIRYGDLQPKEYLRHENYFNDEKLTPESLQSALLEFEKYNFLRGDGKLSAETSYAMKTPRCGLPRITLASKGKWPKFDLNWCLKIPSQKLSVCKQRETLTLAFRIWSRSTIFTFTEVPCDEADIRFFFTWGYPGNGYRFDGQGAHQVYVYMPETNGNDPKDVDIYFDEAEIWQTDVTQKASLLFAAAHAIGHSLGIGHSTDPRSIMIFTFYYPVSLLSSEDKIALQDLYGESVVVETPRPEETAVRWEDPTTEKPAFHKTKTLTLEPTHNPLNNILTPEQETDTKLNIQMTSTSLSKFVSKTKTTPGNFQDINLTVYPNSKTVSTEQVTQDSTTLSIPNTKISAEEDNDSKSNLITNFLKEDRVTNVVLNKNLLLKKLESSGLWLSDQEPESKTEEEHINYKDAGLKQHPEPNSVSTIKLEVMSKDITSPLPGISPSDSEELAGNQPKLIPNLENETNVDLSDEKTPRTREESSSKELAEMVKPGSDQDKQQTPRPETVRTLGNDQNKNIFIWTGAGMMSKRQREAETISSASPEPEAKGFTSKNIGKTNNRLKYIPKHRKEAGINLKTLAESYEKNQKEENVLFKSEPELESKMIHRTEHSQESDLISASKGKSALRENLKVEKRLTTLRTTKVEMTPEKFKESSRKLPKSGNAVLKRLKTTLLEARTDITELRREIQMKEQRDNDSDIHFTANTETIMPAIKIRRTRDKEIHRLTLHPNNITTQSGHAKTRITWTQTNGPLSEQVPTESANSSKLSKILDTQLSTLKDRSLEIISSTTRSGIFRKTLRIKTMEMITENATWPEINGTISLSINLTEQPSPTTNLYVKDKTSTVYPHEKIPVKRPSQCYTKIANCESVFCKFLEKVYKVCCYFYVHICAFFTNTWIPNFDSISA